MTEKCPLRRAVYWYGDPEKDFGIPEVCMEQCGQLIEGASEKTPVDTDYFVDDETLSKASSIEYGGTSLQRGKAASRLTAILNIDPDDGTELYA